MRIGATIFNQNYNDWDRYEAEEQGNPVPKRAARSDREIFQEELNIARMADDLGFDSVWTIEHHFTPYTMVTNPLQYLTYIAGITKRVDRNDGRGAALAQSRARRRRRQHARCLSRIRPQRDLRRRPGPRPTRIRRVEYRPERSQGSI